MKRNHMQNTRPNGDVDEPASPSKKLLLRRETVRDLSWELLRSVHGGPGGTGTNGNKTKAKEGDY